MSGQHTFWKAAGWETFLALSSIGYVTTTQLCLSLRRSGRPTHSRLGADVLPQNCVYKAGGAQIWPAGPCLLTPFLIAQRKVWIPPFNLWATPGDLQDSAALCPLGGSSYFLPAVLTVCLLSLFPLKRSSLSASKTPRPGLCCLLTMWFGSCT